MTYPAEDQAEPKQIGEPAAVYRVKTPDMDALPQWVSNLRNEIITDLNETVGRRLATIERVLRDLTQRPVTPPERDRLLGLAWHDKHLFELLTEEEGFGLELLTTLRSSDALSATQIADRVNMSIDVAMPILAHLVQYGAVEVRNEAFNCTKRGDEFLRTLEKAEALGREISSLGE